jgi:hypothetical protein
MQVRAEKTFTEERAVQEVRIDFAYKLWLF